MTTTDQRAAEQAGGSGRVSSVASAVADAHVGGMLAELREARGLTQGDLARRVGLDVRAVACAEKAAGAYFPPETIEGIVEDLGKVKPLSLEEIAAVLSPSVQARKAERAADAPKPVLAEVLSEMAEAAAKDGTVERTAAGPACSRCHQLHSAVAYTLEEYEHHSGEGLRAGVRRALEAAMNAKPSARAAVCTKPEPSPLTVSYTSVGLMLRGLRLERRIPVLDLAALACMPEEVIEAAELAGPIAPHLMERLLLALDDAFPLSAEQREYFREEVEMSRPWAGQRKGDRPAGVPLTRWDRALFAEAKAKREGSRVDPLSGRVEERA